MITRSTVPEIVVVNQHGDNRGDEAAMRAMVHCLSEGLPGATFTILHQFSDEQSAVALGAPTVYIPLRIPIMEAIRLALFAVLTFLRLPADWVLGSLGREIVRRYRRADLVVSAPGGPYFGDLYANHEIVHWFYVWIAHATGRPLFLYAPSVGPFRNRLMNPVRRRGFRWFDGVALRDEISADYLREFMGEGYRFEVTADSALQTASEPSSGLDGTAGFTLVVAVRDPGGTLRQDYDAGVVEAVSAVCASEETDVVFLPQLHGPRHRDTPYLEGLARAVRGARTVKVESDQTVDSAGHRHIIANADLVIAGRYHPAVFSVAAGTPVLVIPYEHKSLGVARQAGIEDWTIDQAQFRPESAVPAILDMLKNLEHIRAKLQTRGRAMQEAARRTTELAVALVGSR